MSRRRRRSQNNKKKRRLRKQPKMRRVQSATAVPLPKVDVPSTAQRRRRRNRRRWTFPTAALKRFLLSTRWISLGLLAMVIYALYLIGMDTSFYLTKIPVQGASAIPAAEIVAASGLGGGHVFGVDPAEAATAVQEVPGVVSAAVELRWPNQVSIQVEEETPVLAWRVGENRYWVTEDGRLLPARADAPGLLQIDVEESPVAADMRGAVVAAEEAEDTADGEETADAAAEEQSAADHFIPDRVLAGALQLRQLRPNIDKLFYRPSSGLSYQDGRGWRVYFGVGADMAQKLVVYETIVEDLLARELTPVYVSVSNQEKPYYLAQ
jgi:hypothetical protein